MNFLDRPGVVTPKFEFCPEWPTYYSCIIWAQRSEFGKPPNIETKLLGFHMNCTLLQCFRLSENTSSSAQATAWFWSVVNYWLEVQTISNTISFPAGPFHVSLVLLVLIILRGQHHDKQAHESTDMPNRYSTTMLCTVIGSVGTYTTKVTPTKNINIEYFVFS